MYLDRNFLFFDQINNVGKIISFIEKRLKRNFLKSNKLIFVLTVFLLRIEEIMLKNAVLKSNKTFIYVLVLRFTKKIPSFYFYTFLLRIEEIKLKIRFLKFK